MPKRTASANTPYYVLKNANQSIYPAISFENPDTHCVCVYGFSGKPIYDEFTKSTKQPLTPFPLVKGYLSNQIDEAGSAANKGDHLRLVILDATNETQSGLFASTMATVLLAQQEKAQQVSIEFELIFDPNESVYRLKR